MAITISGTGNTAPGVMNQAVLSSQDLQYAYVTGDSSYPAGGYTVTTNVIVNQLQFQNYEILGIQPIYATAGGWAIYWDEVYETIRFFTVPAGSGLAMTEAATGQNLAGVTVQVAFLGS